jgi:hypothetical protein
MPKCTAGEKKLVLSGSFTILETGGGFMLGWRQRCHYHLR